MPENYFTEDVAAAMQAFRAAAERDRHAVELDCFPILPATTAPWWNAAVGMYTAWLELLATRRLRRLDGLPPRIAPARSFTPTYA